MTQNPRQLAFLALRSIYQGAFADVALDRVFQKAALSEVDRRFLTELVYGCVRQQRTLDALIDQLAQKKADRQPPNLRIILHLGLYQLRYLTQIPASAAVNTAVELAKQNGLKGLSGLVNGVLRQYVRLSESGSGDRPAPSEPKADLLVTDPLQLPDDPVQRLGIQYSYPDWIVRVWLEQLGPEETEKLCQALNQAPHIDLRINPLQASRSQVQQAFQAVGMTAEPVLGLPQALRLSGKIGSIRQLPGFQEGWWSVQDSSAQLVGHILDPQPGEVVIDACAAPGGKTTHLAELMGDRGTVWGCDRSANRLKKLQENGDRLQLQSIQIRAEDSRLPSDFDGCADRVLVDAPCSGLGTLHRHADARWRQNPDAVKTLADLQLELLNNAAKWVKPSGILVYATCTLHPAENEHIICQFLKEHPTWQVNYPDQLSALIAEQADAQNWLKIWPHRKGMDGFFIVRLTRSRSDA